MSVVSIIIPTFNSEKTVKAALDSVLYQSFQDWECIIIDGASKDNTLSIIQEYCERDHRFRYISETDHGIYDAFNKGWKMSRSEWVYYLGSDDSLTVDGMRIIIPELDSAYAIVTGDVYLHRNDGTVRTLRTNGFCGCHQGFLMQRLIIDRMGGFDEQYHIIADYDLMARTKQAGYKSKNVRVMLANFSVGGASQKLSSQWEVMKERYHIDRINKTQKCPLLFSLSSFLVMVLSNVYRSLKSGFKR